jgi:hypothetical protein
MLDVALGILACHRLDPFKAADTAAFYTTITALTTLLCYRRPGVAVAVAGGHVAAAPPPAPGAAGSGAGAPLVPSGTASGGGGAGGGGSAAAVAAAAAAAAAAAPWELAPFLREALSMLGPYVDALGRAGEVSVATTFGLEAAGDDPDMGSWPGLMAVQVYSWREAEAESEEDSDEGEEGTGGGGTSKSAFAPGASGGGGATPGHAAGREGGRTDAGDGPYADGGGDALADLEWPPPLKAAASILLALEHGVDSGAACTAAAAAVAMAEAEQRVLALQRLCGAQAQLLWLLFGVDFPWRDRAWGFGVPIASVRRGPEPVGGRLKRGATGPRGQSVNPSGS